MSATAGSPMIYASEHYSTPLLEKLAHGSGALPPNQHFITITVPRGLTYEVFSQASTPGWDSVPATVSKAFGEAWCLERRSLVLVVPSVVARVERNVLINPGHPHFASSICATRRDGCRSIRSRPAFPMRPQWRTSAKSSKSVGSIDRT